MAEQIKTNFLKGVNRRSSRKDSLSPDGWWSLSNARLFKRGKTGKVTRIEGFKEFVSDTTDYSDVLDIETFLDFYIVYYRTGSGTFSVRVFDTSGTQQADFSFNAGDTTEGKISVTNQSIFFAPHNKVLYYNQGDWQLEDYISSIPKINSISKEGGGTVFESTISVDSGASSIPAKKARTLVTIQANNVASGQEDTFQVQVVNDSGYSETSAEITVKYGDTRSDIADKIKIGIEATESTITNDWEVRDSFDGEKTSGRSFYLVALNTGATWNGYRFDIINSNFSIVDRPERSGREGSRVDELRYEEELEDWRREYDDYNATLSSSETSGGRNSQTEHNSLTISFSDRPVRVSTDNIDGDTATGIATKIESALSGINFYSVSRSTNVVTITADLVGSKFNTDINLSIDGEDVTDVFSYTITTVTVGTDNVFSDLGSYKNYWYKIRYRYLDGHITSTSLPVYTDSGANENITLTIQNTDFDINNDRPEVEIYRKREGSEFFLIERLRPTQTTFTFTDDGKANIEPLDERSNIWSKSHKGQDIVENRLVRANVEYFDEDYSTDFTINQVDASDEHILPVGQKTSVYVRPQYSDGSFGFHKNIGEINIQDFGKTLEVTQNSLSSNSEKDISKLGYYIDPKPFGNFDVTTFRSVELSNQNLPAISDSKFYPVNTRVFFGIKYLKVYQDGTEWYVSARLGDWNVIDSDDPIDQEVIIGTTDQTNLPDELDYLGFNYIKIIERSGNSQAVYKLDVFEALEDAVNTGELYLSVNETQLGSKPNNVDREDGSVRTQTESQLSNTERIINDLDLEVQVNSIIDQSGGFQTDEQGNIIMPRDSKLYLSLDESLFDDLDNSNVTDYSLQKDYTTQRLDVRLKLVDASLAFNLLNFSEDTQPSLNGDSRDYSLGETSVLRYDWDEAVYNLSGRKQLRDFNGLIYIGESDNATATHSFDVTGFEDRKDDYINFGYITGYNIYQQIIQNKDVSLSRDQFPTQIIWSDPLVDANLYSGGRNVRPESFLSITENRGEILDVVSISRKLYVFCENGVAQVNVGEIVTQQTGGEMFVDSSTFLTNYVWIADSLKDIKKNSIVRYNNQIYFTDGYDVFRIGQGIENMSQGKIPLDPSNSYSGYIDNKYNEYVLCDLTNDESWSLNTNFGEWFGPHSYSIPQASFVDNQTVGVLVEDIVERAGNDFNGSPFTTVLENTANDSEMGFYDKNWRKFYVGVIGDATLKYYKDINESSPPTKDLSNAIEKNGYKHVGIQPSEQNSKHLFWGIESTDNNFELADLSVDFTPRKRR